VSGQKFRCLAVETASQTCSVAACVGDRSASRQWAAGGEESRQIFSLIGEVLDETGQGLDDLDCIALGCGPGGFTGLRVGAAAVQALAYGAALPVCSVSSLEVLAAGAMRLTGAATAAACLDARMGEAYLGVYVDEGNESLRTVLPDQLVNPEQYVLAAGLPQPMFGAGSGWSAYPALSNANAGRLSGIDGKLVPSAVDLLHRARIRFDRGETLEPQAAQPNYVRNQVTR
jgi:tRNA threonylcarbamoyladenosine biosynthesis protein TsaB